MKKKKALKILAVMLCAFTLLVGAFLVWSVGTAYKPEEEAKAVISLQNGVTVTNEDYGMFFDGKGTQTALIFYPGARVEYTCYAPLLYRIAQSGIDCFALKMPCNMAFFGMNSAEKILGNYSYEHFYISGHSLGGAMAAAYASKNSEKLDGAILFAAYPTAQIEGSDFTLISVYGSEDKVLSFENFEAGRTFMPENYHEVCIDGGNHAWFGDYGEQSGDGKALISHEEQWRKTVEAIKSFITYVE